MPNGLSNKTTETIDVTSMYFYTINGFILAIVNIFLVLLIYVSKNLRNQKEYVIFAGNMIYDAVFGLQYFLAVLESFSRWDCFVTVHGFLFVLNTPAPGIMALLCCLDRFLSVISPIRYLKMPSFYPYILVLMGLVFSSPSMVATAIIDYQDKDIFIVTSVCTLQDTANEFINSVLRGIRIGATISGIILYTFIGYKVFKMMNATKSYTKELSVVKRKRLVAMTSTFSLMTLNEALLFVVPDIIIIINPTASFKFMLSVLNLNKGIVNILVLLITQKELRKTLIEKLYCQNKQTLTSTIIPTQTMRKR